MFADHWRERLQARRVQALFRERRLVDGPQGPVLRIDGREVLAFCSNDYLGLAADPGLVKAAAEAMQSAGFGGAASHLVCGHHREHHALEEALAAFTGREAALLFSTGFMANLGTLAALADRQTTLIEDKLNHASLLDGARLSGATLQRYAHNDLASLEARLQAARGPVVVAVDGVFSMDGDLAPLPEISALCHAHQAVLMVDDAHGFGVLGETGRGTLEQLSVSSSDVPVLMGTLGKALGSFGAFVAGSRDLIDLLVQFARPYIYTTAMPPAVAAASRCSLEIVQREPWRRAHLQALIQQFRAGAAALGLPLMPSLTAIQPVWLGAAEKALAWSEALMQRGLLVTAIRAPTVPEGSARLRVTLTAAHTPAQVDRLLEALGDLQRGAAGT